MKDGKLVIGIIGAGGNTRKMHIPGFQKQEQVELAVVANRTRESAERAARDFGIARVADSWREVAEDPEVDAVCIGTWPNLHEEATVAALENGKHVLCEARMARDLDEAKRMQEAADAHPELVAQLVPAPFSLDFDATVRDWLERGQLGRLNEVRVLHASAACADPEAPMTWRQDVRISGKNVLSMGIFHEIVQRWLEDDPAWVIADGSIFTSSRAYPDASEQLPVDIPETLTSTGRFGGGARMVYHFSGLESGKSRMEIRLNGSAGALRFDAAEKQLFFAEAGSNEEKKIRISRGKSRGWQVEADFVASIREGKPVELTRFDHGLRYMRFTEMVDVSWRQGGAQIAWEDV